MLTLDSPTDKTFLRAGEVCIRKGACFYSLNISTKLIIQDLHIRKSKGQNFAFRAICNFETASRNIQSVQGALQFVNSDLALVPWPSSLAAVPQLSWMSHYSPITVSQPLLSLRHRARIY